MSVLYPIPRPDSLLIAGNGVTSREWYNYFNFLAAGSDVGDLEDDIKIICEKLGSPDGTPGNIPPISGGGKIVGVDSIVTYGALPSVVELSLLGDSANPGNTYYYGTNASGAKGWNSVFSAFAALPGILITDDVDGTVQVAVDQAFSPTWTGNHTFTPSTGQAIKINGLTNTAQFEVNSGNGPTTSYPDVYVHRHGSTANNVANGPNVAMLDTLGGTESILQHSDNQTELWMYDGTSWAQAWFVDASRNLNVAQNVIAAQVTVAADPTLNLQVATKQYVDTAINTRAPKGLITASGLTMNTARLLGRTTAGVGAVEELSVSGSLTLSGGVLTGTGGSGTVTSIDVSGGTTGLTTSGGPITNSGTVTLAGTLNIANGGTGQTTANAAFNALSPMTTNGDLVYRSGGTAVRLPIGSNGQVLGITGGLPVWQSAGGTGTVTSVGLSAPAQFNVTNSPVVSSGTIGLAWATQNANVVLAGPASGSTAAPTFRALTAADQFWPTDYISGLKLTWNSATSISVGTGEAVIPSTSKLEVVSSALTLSGLSLTASTFYHVYLFDNAGTPTIECVTTAPASPYQGTARAKTGDTTRRYLGSALTDAIGNVMAFVHDCDSNMMMYAGNTLPAPFLVLNGGNATTATSVSCSGCVPITSGIGIIAFNNNDTVNTVLVGNSMVPPVASPISASAYIQGSRAFDTLIVLNTSQAFQYLYSAAPSSSVVARVRGYIFDR